MKKINFILMAAALTAGSLTSCVNDSVEENSALTEKAGSPIVLTTNANLTRATSETTTLTSFKLYAFDGTTKYIDGVEFTNGGSGTSYTASTGSYYWPTSGTLNMFAFSPVNAITPTVNAKDDQAFTYTVAADGWTSAVDLLVAPAADIAKASANLTFGHALSQVSFKAKMDASAPYKVIVNSITLNNAKSVLSYDDNVVTANTEVNYVVTPTSAVEATTAGAEVKQGSNLMMLVPQAMEGTINPSAAGDKITGQYITTNITVKNTEGTVTLYEGNVYLNIPSGTTLTAGKRHEFTITYGTQGGSTDGIGYKTDGTKQELGGITLTATVTPWANGDGVNLTF